MTRHFLPCLLLFVSFTAAAQVKTDPWLRDLFLREGNPLLQKVLAQPDSFQYQVIYTRIDRKRNGKPVFTHYFLNVDRNRYFNPASTVKLPVALASLEKINRLRPHGIDAFTTMLTDSAFPGQTRVIKDSSSANGLPSVAHYIKKIFLVSDNDAYNRLYEFMGQEELNRVLREKGYRDVRITRRFVPMNEEQNRHTNPVRFVRDGKILFSQPPARSDFQFDFMEARIGRAHLNRNDSFILAPMDFTTHNNLPLEDLHRMVQSVIFPQSLKRKQRFNLEKDDRDFLLQYMSALPSSSRFPNYDTTKFFDSYAKFFFKGGKQKIPENIRIYNKTGWSYGFLTDAAYVTDTSRGIEFMLSAVIYVNADGVLNDNKYEYESLGYPFFGELYRIIYAYESERKKITDSTD